MTNSKVNKTGALALKQFLNCVSGWDFQEPLESAKGELPRLRIKIWDLPVEYREWFPCEMDSYNPCSSSAL